MSELIQAKKLQDKFNPEYPIMLFPLRVETRFIKTESTVISELGIGTSVGSMTQLAQSLERVMALPPSMDETDKAITTMLRNFATIEKEQKAKKYDPKPIARWKMTLLDTLLDIHGDQFMSNFRASWQNMLELNHTTNDLIIALNKKTFKPTEKLPLLAENVKTFIEGDVKALSQTIEHHQNLEKFTGEGLFLAQEQVFSTIKSLYDRISLVIQVHPEDLKKLEDSLKVMDKVERWNEEALIHMTEYNSYLEKRSESLKSIQEYFNQKHQQNIESPQWSASAKNWKQIMTLKERFRLFEKAQGKFEFQGAFEQLKALGKTLEGIQKKGLHPTGMDDYTIGEFILLEDKVGYYKRRLDTSSKQYNNQIKRYTSRIKASYSYFQGLLKGNNVLVVGEQPAQNWEIVAKELESSIYRFVFNKKAQDYKVLLKELPKLSDLCAQLSFELIKSKFKNGIKNPLLQSWLPKLQKAQDELMAFLEQKEGAFSKEIYTQNQLLSLASKTVLEEAKTLKKAFYLQFWKELQANHLAVEEAVDFSSIKETLVPLVEKYSIKASEFTQNQHFGLAELLGKNKNLLFCQEKKYQEEQQTGAIWKNFIQASIKQLNNLTWEVRDKTSPIKIEFFALLSFWSNQLKTILAQINKEGDLTEQFNEVIQLYQLLFDALRMIDIVSKNDAIILNGMVKGLTIELSKGIEQIELILNSKKEATELFFKEKKAIDQQLAQIDKEIKNNPLYLMWLKNHQMKASVELLSNPSIDRPFDETVVKNAQTLFDELLELRAKNSIPSLLYNNELFKGIKRIRDGLTSYLKTHQNYYSQLHAIHLHIVDIQKESDVLLLERLTESEEGQDEVGENKVLNLIELATQQIVQLSSDQPATYLLNRSLQLQALYLDIQQHVEFIDVVPQEKSQLASALETLKKAYESWQSSLVEKSKPISQSIEKGIKAVENIKAASLNLGIYTGTDNPPIQNAALATNPITNVTVIVCVFPLWPIGGVGGGGGTTDPDPVVLEEHELWIRVYPDYAAITSHDKRLTNIEVQAGTDFWTDYWFAGGDRRMEVGAWRILVEKFGSQRAAWIAKIMRPLNWSQKPSNPIQVTTDAHVFLHQHLGKDDIIIGLKYWETAIPQLEQAEVLKKLKEGLEKRYSKDKAALITYVTKLPSISKALNPLTKSNKVDFGSKNLSAKTINAVINKAKQVQVNQWILSTPIFFPQFPVLDPTTDLKSKAWDSAPFTNILPDQLVFIVYDNDGDLKYEVEGKLIPTKLQTGPDPNNLAQFDPSLPDLGVDGDIKWMTDFNEAVDKGMAIRIPVLNEESDPSLEGTGFSKIFVTGVKHFDGENVVDHHINTFQNDSAALLENLLEGHHYVQDGMSILKPGTPTNTTSEYRSPFAVEESMEASFEREIVGSLPSTANLETTSDAYTLANALGINARVFESIENNNFESIHNAKRMNRALWMTTWGYLLEELDNNKTVVNTAQIKPIIPQETIDILKEYFIESVQGRGALPTIRIGKQPYGILPTSSFRPSNTSDRGWAWDDIVSGTLINGISEANFYNNLTTILLEHFWGYRIEGTTINKSKKWLTVVNEKIRTVDDPVLMGNAAAPFSDGLTATQERFMEVLRLHPRSVEFYNRYGLTLGKDLVTSNSQQLGIVNDFKSWLGFNRGFGFEFSNYYPTAATNQVKLSDTLLSNFKLLNPVVSEVPVGITPLTGPVVDDKLKSKDDRKLSSIDSSNFNYIEWLLQTNPQTIYHKSKAHTEPSKSLLYHSLKDALMNQYWDACARILEDTKLNPTPTRYKDLMFRHHAASTNTNQNTHKVYQEDVPDKTPQYIDRSFYRERYRDFVIDVVDEIKGPILRDPRYADELIFANGRWPIMNMIIKNGELLGHSSNQRLVDFVHQGVLHLGASSPVRVHYPEVMAELLQFREALAVLAQLPTAELEHLFAEHMDLASHRLDAWILGLVNKRLTTMRTTQSSGIYLGAYGWLLNLKPGNKREELGGGSTYHVKVDGSIPEMIDLDNQGHIIAPSLNHAITGAVLKSGYNAHLGSAEEGVLAINLSSKRIRKALFYLEGIRNGQALSALLGYQFERDLIENGLGQYIQAIREEYPLEKITTFANVPQTDLHNTIDGTAFLEAARTVGYPYNVSILPAGAVETLVLAQVDKLFDAIDALGDLAIAEGTYHVVGGNYARAGAMLKALSQQNHIPEPEVIQTPRTGHSLTHRVGLIMNPILSANASPMWASQLTTRAMTEPTLNAWLATQLPNAGDIKCQVYYKVKPGGTTTPGGYSTTPGAHSVVSVADLGIEPIDLFYLFPDNVEQGGSELEKRVKKYVVDTLYSSMVFVTYDKFIVDFKTRDAAWVDTILTMEELSSLIYSLRGLLLKTRPMTAIDVLHPSTPKAATGDDFQINISELQQRVQQLHTRFITHESQLLNDFHSLWIAALDGFESSDLEIEDSPFLLLDYSEPFTRLKKAYAIKLKAYQKVIASIKPTQHHKKQFSLYQEAAQALLGKSFRLLPHFTPHNTVELQNCYTDSSSILPNVQALEMEGWIMGLSRVRTSINEVEQFSLMQSILGGEGDLGLSFAPMQLPYRLNDHWVGLEVPTDYYKNHQGAVPFVSLDKLSLVLALPANFASQTTLSGLIVDEWTELIPNSEETIGVAFHYDEPNAEPAQAILLAVHPETGKAGGKKWHWKQLRDTLDSTLALAKIRAVEPEHLQCAQDTVQSPFDAYAHLLPATYSKVQENNALGGWYTDYGLNIDSPLYGPFTPPSGTGGPIAIGNISIKKDMKFTKKRKF